MALNYWGDACKSAIARPLQHQLDTSHATFGVTVSPPTSGKCTLTLARVDICIPPGCCRERLHVLAVEAAGRREAAAGLGALRMVQWVYVRMQHIRGRGFAFAVVLLHIALQGNTSKCPQRAS